MKILRLVRNIAALFIFGAALLVSRPSAGLSSNPKDTCIGTSNTIGYNCTFNTNGTCSETKCKAGETCNNMRCADFDICPHKCCFCGF